jgi:hypothetical protein
MRLKQAKKQVVLSGPLPEPRRIFDRANLPEHHDHLHFASTLEAGIVLAGELAERDAPKSGTPVAPGPPAVV